MSTIATTEKPTTHSAASTSTKKNASGVLSGERLVEIDALRGIAALMVALYHVWGHDGTYPWYSIGVVTTTPHAHWLSYFTSPLRWGYLGVSFFLVLSGFCIHLPAARKKVNTGEYGVNTRSFFVRRLWRLYPAYSVAVLATSAILLIGSLFPRLHTAEHLGTVNLMDLLTHLTLSHGFFEQTFYSIASVFWSLALEFQLYLAYPLVLILFRKIGTGKAVTILLGVSLLWRYFALSYLSNGLISIAAAGPYAAMGTLFARMPEWLFGAWLAEFYLYGRANERIFSKRSVWNWKMGSVLVLTLALCSTLLPNAWVLTDPLFGIGFTLLTASMILGKRSVYGKTMNAFAALGTISYTFYLFHLQLSWFGAPIAVAMPGLILPFLTRLLWLALDLWIVSKLFPFVEKPFQHIPKPGGRYFKFYRMLERAFGIKTDSPLSAQAAG